MITTSRQYTATCFSFFRSVAGGELFERVVAEEFCLTEQDCVQFLRQILDAMDFVHVQNVLHLDLKPENILCTDASGYNVRCCFEMGVNTLTTTP